MTEETVADEIFDVSVDLEDLEGGAPSLGTVLQVEVDVGFQVFIKGQGPSESFISSLNDNGVVTPESHKAALDQANARTNSAIEAGLAKPRKNKSAPKPRLCLRFLGNTILGDELKSGWGGGTGTRWEVIPMFGSRQDDMELEDFQPRAYETIKEQLIIPIVEHEGYEKQGEVFGNTFWVSHYFRPDPYAVWQIERALNGDDDVWQTYKNAAEELVEKYGEAVTVDEVEASDWKEWTPVFTGVYWSEAEAAEVAGDSTPHLSIPAAPEGWDNANGPWQQTFQNIVDTYMKSGNDEDSLEGYQLFTIEEDGFEISDDVIQAAIERAVQQEAADTLAF